MTDGMKTVKMTNEQAQFLYAILNNAKLVPMPDIASTRKINRVFDAIEPPLKKYEDAVEKATEPFLKGQVTEKNQPMVDSFGELVKGVPGSKRAEADKALEPLAKKEQSYEIEREALSYAQTRFESVVKDNYKEGKDKEIPEGIGGRRMIRLFTEVLQALEDAKTKS